MTTQTAIDNLMTNYGDIAGLERQKLERLIESGLSEGFSVRQVYNGIRLVLGMEYQQQEIISASEATEMLEISEREIFSRMESIGAEPIKAKRKIY